MGCSRHVGLAHDTVQQDQIIYCPCIGPCDITSLLQTVFSSIGDVADPTWQTWCWTFDGELYGVQHPEMHALDWRRVLPSPIQITVLVST